MSVKAILSYSEPAERARFEAHNAPYIVKASKTYKTAGGRFHRVYYDLELPDESADFPDHDTVQACY